jgi:hypothetical protein
MIAYVAEWSADASRASYSGSNPDVGFFTGSIFITLSEKKQWLYDIIAGTLVVKRY